METGYLPITHPPTHPPTHPHKYSAEYPDKPWNDNCEVDPKLSKMTSPPDTRPYCKTMAKILRLKVNEPPTHPPTHLLSKGAYALPPTHPPPTHLLE